MMASLIKTIYFWRKNSIKLAFLFLLIFTAVSLFQIEIVRMVRTFGTNIEMKLDDIPATVQPSNFDGISNGDYIQINLEFRVDEATGYPNLFQTDVGNSGIRAEVNGSMLSLIFPTPNEKSRPKVFILSDRLRLGNWYSINLEALKGSFLVAKFSGTNVSHSEAANHEFSTGNTRVGIGYDDTRRFQGEIRNVTITTGSARAPWVGTFAVYTTKIFLLALIIICLYAGSKEGGYKKSIFLRVAQLHFIVSIPIIAYFVINSEVALKQFNYPGNPFYELLGWVNFWPSFYLGSIIEYALLLMMPLVFVVYKRHEWQLGSTRYALLGMFVVYELICISLFSAASNLAGIFLWMAVAGLLPAYILFNQRRLMVSTKLKRAAMVACLTLLIGVVASLLSTSWSPNLRFLNDYADLPEYTILKNNQQVENRAYLQKHAVQGEYFYDPCESLVDESCLHLPRRIFSSERIAFNVFPPGRGLVYDWDKEILKAYRPLTIVDIETIKKLWGVEVNLELGRQDKKQASNVSPDLNEFLFKNRLELGAQASLGRFIYHHAYLYLPALETALSLPTGVTPVQYGKGLTHTLGVLLGISDTPNFQTYYKIYWIGIITYLILLGAIAWWITRSKWIGIAASATGIVFVMSVAPDALRMAPGFNPIRHLPDLFCLMIIAIDSRRNSYGSALLRAIAIAVFLWWNKEFGIFMLFGSIVWHFFEIAAGYRHWRAGLGRVAIEFVLAILILVISGGGESNGLVFYNLMGIGLPYTGWRDAIFPLTIWIPAIIVAAWGRFFWSSDLPNEAAINRSLLDVSGVGLIYVGFATIYALWNPSPNHYAVVSLCAVLPFATIFVWGHLRLAVIDFRFSWLPKYIAASTTVMALAFASHDRLVFQEYDQVFKEHRVFEWNFTGLVGLTTADPKLLEQSAELIQKYQPEGRILFVSRYGTLMQTALNRPGVLPYIDIPGAVVSWRMIDRVAARINELKPAYIFADRDLQVDKDWAVKAFSYDSSVVTPSSHRVGSLAALAQVMRSVTPCYASGEVQGALQVWYRTCK